MAGFFDDSDDESQPSIPAARRGTDAESSIGGASSSRNPGPNRAGGRSFVRQLESTLSPKSSSSSRQTPSGVESSARGEGAGARAGGRVAVPMTDDDMSSMRGTSAPGGRYGYGYGAGEMDLDMDDDRTERGSTRGGPGPTGMILGVEDEDEDKHDADLDDVKRLGRAWVRERGTQAIHQWEGDLMDSLFDKLEQQQKMVALLKSDPQTSEEEHFKLVLVQTEMERVKYLVRSYVRTRLSKIEKYSHHIVLTPELHPLLSGAELSHARRYTELLHAHYQHSVLDSLPEWLRGMDDTSNGLDMVTRPNLNTPVLVYCRKDCGEITLPDGEIADLVKGSTHLVKYNLIEQWIKLGWAEVL